VIRSLRRAAHLERWTDGQNQEHGSLERRTDRFWLLRASGWFASRRDLIRAKGLSRAAARCRVSRRITGSTRARAVGEARFRNRASGLSDRVGVRRARRGTPARRCVSGVGGSGRAPSMPRGCSPPAPSFVRAVRSLGSLGSSRTACWGHQDRSRHRSSRHRAAWRLIRNAVVSSQQPCRARAHSDILVIRSVRGERPECFCVSRLGFHHRWRHHAPLGGSLEDPGSLSNVVVGDRSFERPSNKQMEPSRPTVLCDPVTAARGSFAPLDRLNEPMA